MFKNPLRNLILSYVLMLVIGICIGVFGYSHWGPQPTVKILPSDTKTVYLPKTQIETRDVVKYVTDKTEVTKLMAENKALKQNVVLLNETIAQYKATNTGPVVVTPPPVTNPAGPTTTEFRDWRLYFVSNGTTARYELNQRFEVLNTVAKERKTGLPVTTTRLFEIDDKDARILIPAKSTVIVANPGARWYFDLNVQAGIVFTYDDSKSINGAVFGAQWLKHGSTHAPVDTRYAVLTPVVFLSNGITEPGILPLSFNLGTLPYQPFTNIWLSPYLGFSVASRSVSRVGVAISATF